MTLNQAPVNIASENVETGQALADVARDLADGTVEPVDVLDQTHRHMTGNEPRRHV